MDQYQETFDTWNKVASLYQDKFMNLDLYNESYDHICHSITNASACILDLGCGPGNISKYLLSKRPDFDILGIDIAPTMIELAKQHNPTARFETMDIRQIDQINTRFDGIMAGFCLPYLSPTDSQKWIRDCSHLLHEKGLIYISFVEGDPEHSGFKTASTGDRTFFYYYQLDDLTRELSNNHFDLVKIFRVDFKRNESEMEKHTILIAIKKTPGNLPDAD